ncbi:N-acetylneuraminate synthase [Candidatus Woesearchaeota archaeon]|nr:N-acetylneuraminate synthase [Candidatus Woesearchaeota archaeon]
MMRINIGGRGIGENEPCFIIAEAGVNHNGSLELAKKLVDAAKDAGADAVKFQTFKSEDLIAEKTPMAKYQEENIGGGETQLQMLKRLELDYNNFKALKKYCDEKDIIFLSTPHTNDAIDFLDKMMPAFKIGSGDLTNIPFLKKAAKKLKPMILGTGMSTLEEVKEALSEIYEAGNREVIMLHCTTSYPCPKNEVNLRAMQTMQKELDSLVGYSDHTLGIDVPQMAVKLGAVLIEKHFTLDRGMEGPDHKASLEPDELKEMITAIKNKDYEKIKLDGGVLGSAEKKPTKSEIENAKVARKSIVAARNIAKGEKLSFGNLAIKRPGIGLKPKDIYSIIGKKANAQIMKDELLSLEKIE